MKKTLLVIIAISFSMLLHAQQYLGIRNSNYAGISGAGLNPSFIVGSKLDWDVNVLAQAIVCDNTFLYIPKELLHPFGFRNIIEDVIDQKEFTTHFDPQNPNELFDFDYSQEILGPSFMISMGSRHEIGLITAARLYTNLNDITGHFSQNAFASLSDPSLWYTTWHDNTAKYNTMGWFEYGINYATIIYAKGKHEWKGGIALKYLQGIGAAYFKNTDLTYNIMDTTQLIFTNTSIDYGRTDLNSFEDASGYNDLIHGNGFGGNIGFTYVHLKDSSEYTYMMDCKKLVDPDKSKYVYRIGLSLIDAGVINFNKNAASFHLEADSANYLNWKQSDFSDNFDFDRTMSAVFYNNDSTQSFTDNHFRMALPAAISVQADWNFYKNFYINATIVKGFGHGNNQGVIRPDVYSVTPRFESKWFEVSLPLSLLYYNHWQPRIGLAVRAGYFFIGGDALGSLLALNDLEGSDFYAGVHFFIPEKKLKDRDDDQVSDDLDICPDAKGTCEAHGCPDQDRDGIVDRFDECPEERGLAFLRGCPDSDLDSIPDKDDQCPDLKGLKSLQGCPDSDDDGIVDPEDSCVSSKGLPQYHGCPDTDNDAIPDHEDECPNDAGTPLSHGCPDSDSDGIADHKDKCPDVSGPSEYDGCPPTVPDKMVNDVLVSSRRIQFGVNSSTIPKNLFSELDHIAEVMRQYPKSRWMIEGYTDITGSDSYNIKLSDRRAQSVKDYLVSKGIRTDNLITQGLGKKNPVATNKTAAERARNRRVEIKEQK